jgi:hypothetical protein
MSKRRKASEVWDRLAMEAGEDEIEAAAAMTDAQVDEYLAASGLDTPAVRSQADAFLAALAAPRPDAPAIEKPAPDRKAAVAPVPKAEPRRRVPAGVVLVAAAVAVGGAVGTYVALHQGPPGPDQPRPEPPHPPPPSTVAPAPSDLLSARELRQRAVEEYANHNLMGAQRWLEEAKAIDPEGDEAPEVQELRRKLLHDKPDLK